MAITLNGQRAGESGVESVHRRYYEGRVDIDDLVIEVSTSGSQQMKAALAQHLVDYARDLVAVSERLDA